MQTFIANIVLFSVSLFFNALRFIPGITPEIVTQAVTDFKIGLDTALAAYVANPTETAAVVAEDMIHDGLQITKNALDAAGKTTADQWIDEADSIDVAIEKGTSPFLAVVKAGWNKVFHKNA